MKKLIITSLVDKNELVENIINQLTDEEKSELAIDFGNGGDYTYELILLKKLIGEILSGYSLKSLSKDEDLEFVKLIEKLTEISPIVNKIKL
jgi:hypothetical protein